MVAQMGILSIKRLFLYCEGKDQQIKKRVIIASIVCLLLIFALSATAFAYTESDRDIGTFGQDNYVNLQLNEVRNFSTTRLKCFTNRKAILNMDTCLQDFSEGDYGSIYAWVKNSAGTKVTGTVQAYDESLGSGAGTNGDRYFMYYYSGKGDAGKYYKLTIQNATGEGQCFVSGSWCPDAESTD